MADEKKKAKFIPQPPGQTAPPVDTSVKYCWRESKLAETAFGVFDSVEAAVADARYKLRHTDIEPGETVLVGTCSYPDPGDVAARITDLDEIAERMDEWACDNIYPWEQEVFGLKDARSGAAAALQALVRQWATEYLKADSWHSIDEQEVNLSDYPDEVREPLPPAE